MSIKSGRSTEHVYLTPTPSFRRWRRAGQLYEYRHAGLVIVDSGMGDLRRATNERRHLLSLQPKA
jgi:hypothetical protein